MKNFVWSVFTANFCIEIICMPFVYDSRFALLPIETTGGRHRRHRRRHRHHRPYRRHHDFPAFTLYSSWYHHHRRRHHPRGRHRRHHRLRRRRRRVLADVSSLVEGRGLIKISIYDSGHKKFTVCRLWASRLRARRLLSSFSRLQSISAFRLSPPFLPCKTEEKKRTRTKFCLLSCSMFDRTPMKSFNLQYIDEVTRQRWEPLILGFFGQVKINHDRLSISLSFLQSISLNVRQSVLS